VDRETRGRAKTINFAILYGISRWGLAGRLGVTPEEAQAMIDTYFQRFPGIQRYIHETLEVRERAIPKRCSGANAGSRASVRRIRPSGRAASAPRSTPRSRAPAPTSSSAPWPAWARRWPRRVCPMCGCCLQVHDELVFELPEGDVEAARPVIERDGRSRALPWRSACRWGGNRRGRQLGRGALMLAQFFSSLLGAAKSAPAGLPLALPTPSLDADDLPSLPNCATGRGGSLIRRLPQAWRWGCAGAALGGIHLSAPHGSSQRRGCGNRGRRPALPRRALGDGGHRAGPADNADKLLAKIWGPFERFAVPAITGWVLYAMVKTGAELLAAAPGATTTR
jgi:hypothetical protein